MQEEILKGILQDLAEMMTMAGALPWAAAFPLYVIGYSLAGLCLVALVDRVHRVIREW